MRLTVAALLTFIFVVSRSKRPEPWDLGMLTGQILGEGEIPPYAIVKIELEDASLAKSVIVARSAIHTPGKFPIPFRINYDRGIIEHNKSFSVSVRIEDPKQNDRILYKSEMPVYVLTKGNPADKIVVRLVKT
ncbi:hypothetical protein ACOME3_001027 [Neoechinorhynchus agilis]